ncbi:condensation domain-containing protein, partial [Nocardia sp. NPDC060256]|uniref:condensation domain-containing protein n=1 Tax=unclassified Nocardia TaxID=2637762 RepID=UPI003661D082
MISKIRSALGVEVPIRVLFEAATVAELVEHLDTGVRVRLGLSVWERPARVPLSFAQRRLWFLHRLEGPSATYNLPTALRVTGALDVLALRLAVGDLVSRHETLRTMFPELGDTPTQQILSAEAAETGWQIVDVTGWSQKKFQKAVAQAARYPFDLASEIPVRVSVFRRAPEEHVVLLLVHHIAADGWSTALLMRDLSQAYAARRRGVAPRWEPLPVQYVDYTLWQRELLGDRQDPNSLISRQFDYWGGELAGLPEVLQLPTDRPRPPAATYRGGLVPFEIDPRTRAAVEQLARREDATVSMVLQAALAVLLFRLGAGDDIPVGAPIAGRTDDALTDLVGFFVNTCVLRTAVAADQSFRALLTQVRGKALAAYENQDAPFDLLVELLNPVRSPAHHPLFQVALAFQNNQLPDLRFPEARVEEITAPTGTSRFDLFFNIVDTPVDGARSTGWSGFVEYATDLFDQESIEMLVARFIRVLRQAAAEPTRAVGRLDVLDEVERRRVLEVWNDTTVSLPDVTVPD